MNASCHARVAHDRHANRWICLAPCASLPGEVPFIGTRFLVCSTILAGMIGALSPRPAAAQSQQAATTAEPSDEQAATQASAQETESPASATGDAVDPTDEPLPPTVMFLHSNGSVTVTVDGKEHQLSPSQMNRRLPQLLAGKEHIGIRMEEWKYFERAFGAMKLYPMGIRRITLDSGTARRTLEVPAPMLFQVINSGTPAERQKALDEVEKLFRDGKSWQAMEVVRMTYQTQYDRSRFLPYVRDALQSDSENAWGPAISTISLVGGDESDVPLVLKHADHEDDRIRARIANTLTDLDPQGSNPGVNPAIRKLLDDDSHWVRSSTIQSLSGFATSPDVEAKLIELSRGESRGGSSQADTTIKSALTSRPLIRKPVAERLIELIDSNSRHKRKAIKGLCHKADDEARPLVVDALIDVIDSDVDSHVRSDAITGLGLVGGEQAWKKLQMIAMNPNELESDRKTARYFTPRDLPAPTDDAGNPISPPPVKLPPDLWRQIAQDHDPDARQWAIQRMTKMLQDESSAVPGLGVLIKVHEAKFDRTALVPLVRGWLASEDEQIRSKALIAMGTLDDPAIKVTELASYSNDNSPIVRGVVLSALLGVDPEARTFRDAGDNRSLAERRELGSGPRRCQVALGCSHDTRGGRSADRP